MQLDFESSEFNLYGDSEDDGEYSPTVIHTINGTESNDYDTYEAYDSIRLDPSAEEFVPLAIKKANSDLFRSELKSREEGLMSYMSMAVNLCTERDDQAALEIFRSHFHSVSGESWNRATFDRSRIRWQSTTLAEAAGIVQSTREQLLEQEIKITESDFTKNQFDGLKGWESIGHRGRSLFIAVAHAWIDRGYNPPLVAHDLATIFMFNLQSVVDILRSFFPDYSFYSEQKDLPSVGSILRDVGSVLDITVSSERQVTDLSQLMKPYLPIIDEESMMWSSLNTFLGNFTSTGFKDVATIDIDPLIKDLISLKDDASSDWYIRGRECVAEYTVHPMTFSDSPHPLWMKFVKAKSGADPPPIRTGLAVPSYMRYCADYPSNFSVIDLTLSLGTSSQYTFTGKAVVANGVTHPLAPREKRTFKVIMVDFVSHLSPRELLGMIEHRTTTTPISSIVYSEDKEDYTHRLGYDCSFFLDGTLFVFVVADGRNYTISTVTGLHTFALPVLTWIGGISPTMAPNLIAPLQIYATLKRSLRLQEAIQRQLDAKRAMLLERKRQGDREKADAITRAHASVHLNDFLLFMDHSYSGMRAFICAMLAVCLSDPELEGLDIEKRSQLDAILFRLASGTTMAIKQYKAVYVANFKAGGERDARKALSILMSYYHILTTVRVFSCAHRIFDPLTLQEDLGDLSTMDSTLTFLVKRFSEDSIINSYFDISLLDQFSGDFLTPGLI